MKNLILKMVASNVISSNVGNRLLNIKDGTDLLWNGLSKGLIDEKRLIRFYEQNNFPIIYQEGYAHSNDNTFSNFFTPDIIAKYLVFPISFKKENRDIIIGFLNSEHIEAVKQMIKKIFPDFNTTFFHIPFSLFKQMIYRYFMFDIEKYIEAIKTLRNTNRVSIDEDESISTIFNKLNNLAEQVFLCKIKGEVIEYKDDSMLNRFPLNSLPLISESLTREYTEIELLNSMDSLGHTEKIMFLTNMQMKKDDKVAILTLTGGKFFFLIVNPSVGKSEIIQVLDA